MKFGILSLFFILSVSCSMFKSKQELVVERTVASIEPNQLKIDEIKGDVYVSINFEVFGRHKGNNAFSIDLPARLHNDLRHDLPYHVFINSNDVSCLKNYTIEEIERNYKYKINGSLNSGKIDCIYMGMEDKKLISVTYIFHKIEHIPLELANPYIQPVNNEARDATRLLKKVKEGKDIQYYESRLLFDIFADRKIVVFDPTKDGFGLDIKLAPLDIVSLSDPRGEMIIPQLGKVNFKGKSNRSFYKKNKAGKKYLAQKDVSPYATFCLVTPPHGSSFVMDFQWANQLILYDSKRIQCGINLKNTSKRKRAKAEGKMQVDLAIVRYNKLEKKISDYLKEPQATLDKFVDDLNKRNLNLVREMAKKTIDRQKKVITTEMALSEQFPYSVEREFRLHQMYLIHHPVVSDVKYQDKIYRYVDLEVTADVEVEDVETGEHYELGRISLGNIQTNKKIQGDEALYNYEIYTRVCGKNYAESFTPYFKNLIEKQRSDQRNFTDFEDYKKFIRDLRELSCEGKNSEPTVLTLKRKILRKCGNVTSYKKLEARSYVEKGMIHIDHLSAFYDALENSLQDWRTRQLNLYKADIPLASPQQIKTDLPVEKVEECQDISVQEASELAQ